MADVLLHEVFDLTWQRWPDRIAIDVPPGRERPDRVRITYAELADRSARITAALAPFVPGECVVALSAPRTSPDAFAAQIGVLRAGAAFSAIDASFPDDRVREILQGSRAVALVTDDAGAARAVRVGFDPARIVNVDREELDKQFANHQITKLPNHQITGSTWLSPSTLAYIIYTSGTTGRPKGVMIEHRAIVNLVDGDREQFQLSGADRVAQGSSHAYDSSIEEMWLAFAAGATVVVMDDDAARAGPDLVSWLDRERVTVFCPPPTLLRSMGKHAARSLTHLKLLYVGGEALPQDVADDWSVGRRMVNGYGPTECAVTSVRSEIHAGEPVSIGRPVPGLHACILDATLEEVPDGERGELCLGGVGLARGYWDAPELTEKKFITHSRLGRLYRTGDVAHRDAAGVYFSHGRIDAQVKIRGYRVELEDIESHLARCEGVRAVACSVEVDGARQTLVAFVVPVDIESPPDRDALRAALSSALPAYMVPSQFQFVGSLPTTTGGKLDRAALPRVARQAQALTSGAPATTRAEILMESIVRRVTGHAHPVSVDDDFFVDLGGDSLRAAECVTAFREHEETSAVTVRDLYDARTIRRMAVRVTDAVDAPVVHTAAPHLRGGSPGIASILQSAWLAGELVIGALIAYVVTMDLIPWCLARCGLVTLVSLAPVVLAGAVVIYAPAAVLIAVALKRAIIGRYTERQAAVWGPFYVRNWIVQQIVKRIPWWLLSGTEWQCVALRALGARIGQRVHIHRGVDITQGGWDLLDIGDDVTIGQDAEVRLVDFSNGEIHVAPIVLEDGVTLEVRAGVCGHTHMEAHSQLAALSSLPSGARVPSGERWAGVPASRAGRAPDRVDVSRRGHVLSAMPFSAVLLLAELAVGLVLALPLQVVALALSASRGLTASDLVAWMLTPTWTSSSIGALMILAALPVPLMVAGQAMVIRLLGPVKPGVIDRWSYAYMRVWIKTRLLESAGDWLSGGLMWPIWLRAAGMPIGPDCEISTIIDVVPELIEIGATSFLADGIYLGGPRVDRGTVTLAATRLGSGAFIGNHAVIPCGQQLADHVLIGVSTVADDAVMRADSAWFGMPPFELPRKPLEGWDRRLTHEPSAIRYINRQFWEWLRFAIPVVPMLVFVAWLSAISNSSAQVSFARLAGVVVPLATLYAALALATSVLVMKWLLIGRVRPSEHALWSCWCSRWDFLYVAWGMIAAPVLASCEGTLLLTWYLRAMGARIGRRVVLGGGFSQVVDPDMFDIEDDAVVQALFQAHTFEDRVLKIDHVRIRRGANVASGVVLLYGADIGEDAVVAEHSVVMKREHLLGGRTYSGCPTREV